MNLSETDRLSVLACVTGIAMVATFFIAFGLGEPSPEWLPLAIAAIAGFELFLFVQELVKRRRNPHG